MDIKRYKKYFSLSFLINEIKSYMHNTSNPHKIAGGFAVGIFIAMQPIYGFQTIVSILIATIMPFLHRGSIIIGTQMCLPPFIPFILIANQWTGSLIWQKDFYIPNIHDIEVFEELKILVTGSVINGVIAGIIAYAVIFVVAKYIYRK